MNTFVQRCAKEAARVRSIALFVLGIAALGLAYDIVARNLVYFSSHRMLGYNLLQTVVFMFPAILWYSLTQDHDDTTSPQYMIIASKLLAVLFWGVMLVAVIAGSSMVRTLIVNRIGLLQYTAERVWAFRPATLPYAPVGTFRMTLVEYWLPVAYWCGAVTFAEGLSYGLKQSRLVIYTLSIILAMVVNTYFRGFTVIPHYSLAPFGLLFMLGGIWIARRHTKSNVAS